MKYFAIKLPFSIPLLRILRRHPISVSDSARLHQTGDAEPMHVRHYHSGDNTGILFMTESQVSAKHTSPPKEASRAAERCAPFTHFSDIWADAQRARGNARILRNLFFAEVFVEVRRTLARKFDQFFMKRDADHAHRSRNDASSATFQSPIAKFDQ
jgi:hypothetical protein